MKAVILSGGLGTRLRTIVADRPKPMAEVQGKPFLEHLIGRLREQGLCELVLCVGHMADIVSGYFGDGKRWGVRLQYAVETELRGTAGAVLNARSLLHGPFLVLNGDSYLDIDLRALVEHHQLQRAEHARTLGTIAAVKAEDAAAYGTLEWDAQGRIKRLGEKASAGAGWINGGVYVLEAQLLDLIPAGRAVSIERETFPQLLERGYTLHAFPVEGFFADIGTAEGYRRFQRYVGVNRET